MSHSPHCDCGGGPQSAKLWAAVRANAPKPKVRSVSGGLLVIAFGLLTVVACAARVHLDGVTVVSAITALVGVPAGLVCVTCGIALFRGQA